MEFENYKVVNAHDMPFQMLSRSELLSFRNAAVIEPVISMNIGSLGRQQEPALSDRISKPDAYGFDQSNDRFSEAKNIEDAGPCIREKGQVEVRKLLKILRLKELAVKDAERARAAALKTVSELKEENVLLRDQDSAHERQLMENFYMEVKGKITAIEEMAKTLVKDVVTGEQSLQAIANDMQPAALAFEQVWKEHVKLTMSLYSERQTSEDLNQVANNAALYTTSASPGVGFNSDLKIIQSHEIGIFATDTLSTLGTGNEGPKSERIEGRN